MIDWLISLDYRLFSLINASHAPWANEVMVALSNKVNWVPFYLLMGALLVRKMGWARAGWAALTIALTIILSDIVSVHLFKNVFERLRPSHDPLLAHSIRLLADADGNPIRGGLYGFVSSHAVNHFALAVLFSFFLSKKTWHTVLFFIWATAIGYSRVYLGMHFPGDVLVGGLLGMVMAGLAILVWRKTGGTVRV